MAHQLPSFYVPALLHQTRCSPIHQAYFEFFAILSSISNQKTLVLLGEILKSRPGLLLRLFSDCRGSPQKSFVSLSALISHLQDSSIVWVELVTEFKRQSINGGVLI